MAEAKRSPGPKETLLGLFLLGVLAAIAAGIYVDQYRFYPDLIEHTADLRVKSGFGEGAATIFSRFELPDNLTPFSESEHFDAKRLSDKINGKAELYLSAGFVRLETRRFQVNAHPESWMEAFIYRMRDPQSAFAVFSMQKRKDGIPAELGQAAYSTANALYLVQGPYYLELVASTETSMMKDALHALASAFVKAFPEAQGPAPEKPYFPPEGLNPESILLIPADAFGLETLDRIYTAEYRLEDAVMTAFVSLRADANEARMLSTAYRDFLLQFDAQPLESPFPDQKGWTALSVMGMTEIFFSQGPYFAGVHQAADPEKAMALTAYLNDHLTGMLPAIPAFKAGSREAISK